VSAARSETRGRLPRTATGLRKQRLETRPQRIVQEGLCHARPYQVDRASTRDQSEVLKLRSKVVDDFRAQIDSHCLLPGRAAVLDFP